jgi:hypothetical protein
VKYVLVDNEDDFDPTHTQVLSGPAYQEEIKKSMK